MFFLVQDFNPDDPNPHSWEITDVGPFDTYEEAEACAREDAEEMRREYELADDDEMEWHRWAIVELRPGVRRRVFDALVKVMELRP